ncbi:hypothetical protein [Frigoriflavimonas asaccharolytica]|uniref:Uncharacterized protein n=1 Tax=Frigoriflavimonas asaccharolytica TaxID=2735899 RepID=A0A8J8GD84_9FLAO|nr:hypothetical protein [Frigoriflavimonas asaccharolytica]NRS94109.1 hypothetical protein [Frigoriflavimonas asaccharolytica]
MQKKTVYILLLSIFLVAIYIGYQLNKQDNEDEILIYQCQSNPNVNTTITFVVKKDQMTSKDFVIKLNSKDTILDKSYSDSNSTNEYSFSHTFVKGDKVEIVLMQKTYVIDRFQFSSVIINRKKGLECKFDGAFLNGIRYNSDVFILK